MTAGLSKSTDHKPNPIGIQGICNQINACKCVKVEQKEIYMVKDTCLDSSLAVAQSLVLRDLEGYRRSQCLNNNDRK